jgi:hypothetical protein
MACLPCLRLLPLALKDCLSGFVSRLREADHAARVVVRSVEPTAMGREAAGSIELRVRMHVGSRHNPAYRSSGHVRVSMSEYTGWRLDLSLSREESGNRYGTGSGPKTENMAREQLEAEVMGMLDRLKTRSY